MHTYTVHKHSTVTVLVALHFIKIAVYTKRDMDRREYLAELNVRLRPTIASLNTYQHLQGQFW